MFSSREREKPNALKVIVARALEKYYPVGMILYRLYTKNRNYEPEIWLVPRFVTPHTTAIDIGANVGIWSWQLHRYADRVCAFEPNPLCIEDLMRVLPRNVALYRVALSDTNATTSLRYDPGNTGIGTIEARNTLTENAGIKSIVSHEVETRRLDDYGFKDVALIKVDVEGHEEAVLRGAEATIEANRPTIICEIEERHNPGGLDRARQWLGARGYQTFVLRDGQITDLDTVVVSGDIEIASPSGINNFIFVHESNLGRLTPDGGASKA